MGAGMESRTDSSTIIMGQETDLDNFLAIKIIFILKLQVYELCPFIPTMAETWLPVSTLNTYCCWCMKFTTHIRTSSDPIPYQG